MASGPTLPHRRVYPSGADLATASLPIVPPAPPRLSTRICCPSAADHDWPTRRAVASTDSPAGKGTTRRIGFAGYCAKAPVPKTRETRKRSSRFISSRSEVGRNPVRNIGDPQRPVVDLAMLRPTLLGRKDLERLFLCRERGVQPVRRLHRHDSVVRPVCDEHGAGDLVGDSGERKLLRALQRRLRVIEPQYPPELEIRLRTLLRIGFQLLLDLRLPRVQVPVQGTQAHAGGVALFEGGDARRVVAAEAVAHDDDPLGIDIRAARHELVGRGARHFVIVARVDLAKPQRLALPRTVDRERMKSPPRELQAREKDAHLLAVVHAVEEHDGRRTALRTQRSHEVRRQRLAFVRHFDELDVPVPAFQAFLVAAQRLLVDVELALARRNEALAGVVVITRAQVVVTRGELAAVDRRGVGHLLVLLRHRAPFLPPRVGVAHAARGQPLADPVDLPDRDRAVGRHALAHESRVRPHAIAGKMIDPGALRHPCPPRFLRCAQAYNSPNYVPQWEWVVDIRAAGAQTGIP